MIDDDKTVFKPRVSQHTAAEDGERTVFIANLREKLLAELFDQGGKPIAQATFDQALSVGRADENTLVIKLDTISRQHLQVKLEADGWFLHNLKSTNGLYLNGELVAERTPLTFPARVALGHSGIELRISKIGGVPLEPLPLQAPPAPGAVEARDDALTAAHPAPPIIPTSSVIRSQAELEARLLASEDSADMGDYTLMVRRVIKQDQLKRGKSYRKAIWVLAGLFVLAVGLVTYQQFALENNRQLALDMFYDIKSLEVNLAQADIKLEQHAEVLDRALAAMSDEKLRATQEQLKQQQEKIAAEKLRMQQERERLSLMKAKYRQYVEQANALRLSFPSSEGYENELIARVAREFGESELEVPPEFSAEVRKYIGYWQASARLPKAINNLEVNGLLPVITDALEKHGLSAYFLYLPLQESNFDTQAIGPETRFGIAKGAWQLLAGTAQQYGITPGPLVAAREFDQFDERFDFAKATLAGVRYLKYIFSTEAQASGLLVMASYNYGDNRVRNMIGQMPDNPRDRNFWKFLQQYQLPAETRDYVFYIFSAAVIGEDPSHFGFKFAPPLYKAKS